MEESTWWMQPVSDWRALFDEAVEALSKDDCNPLDIQHKNLLLKLLCAILSEIVVNKNLLESRNDFLVLLRGVHYPEYRQDKVFETYGALQKLCLSLPRDPILLWGLDVIDIEGLVIYKGDVNYTPKLLSIAHTFKAPENVDDGNAGVGVNVVEHSNGYPMDFNTKRSNDHSRRLCLCQRQQNFMKRNPRRMLTANNPGSQHTSCEAHLKTKEINYIYNDLDVPPEAKKTKHGEADVLKSAQDEQSAAEEVEWTMHFRMPSGCVTGSRNLTKIKPHSIC
jgi:hypothetical protein